MISITHFAVGAAIARHVPHKPLVLGLAFFSHYLLDAIPHFENPLFLPQRWQNTAYDLWHLTLPVIAMLTIILVAVTILRLRGMADQLQHPLWFVVMAGLVSVSPDVLALLGGPQGFFWRLNDAPHQLWAEHFIILNAVRPDLRLLIVSGMVFVEAGIIAAACFFLLRNRRNIKRDTHGDS